MFLSKSPSGIYYLYYSDILGKRQKVSTRQTLKTDALKFLQAFDAEEVRKRATRKNASLQSFMTDFLTYATGNYAKSTVTIYRSALNRLLCVAGNVPLASITAQRFDTYRVERLLDISPASVNIEMRTLRACFNTALRWGLIERNPFAKVKLASVPEATPTFFSKEDFQKLLNAIKEGWLKEIIVFAALTGLRRGEIVNLHWSDVSFDRKTLTVQSSQTFKTKQGKRRVVPLNDTALYLLQSRANKEISELVFTLNGKLISAGWLSHKFKYYVYECRFKNDKLHFHSLRHTFASWLVQDGVSIYAVKELLGHSDVKTTQVYSHLSGSELHKEVNRIAVLLN